MQINIGIVDDQLLFLKGMVSLLERYKGFNVLWEAQSGAEAMDRLHEQPEKTDIILLDLNMPGTDGIEVIKQLKEKFPDIKVIILSIHDEERFIIRLIELGANSYLVKNASPEEVEKTIRITSEKGFYFNDRISNILFSNINGTRKRTALATDFTKREQEVLQCICEDLSTKDIAKKLFISERTVEGHRNSLILKTNVKNTAGLVIFAVKNNHVDLNFYLKKY
ncbi:DNA-binding NarL/FixJ family response regulator [Pedobacter cryoconitis]|uniref:DNA-binding NarL/FixJ family response regulator n=1 Tax=Pedobacter cryoconitis TaxID=188932 RepID=A0A7W8ZMS3_9SPHI|nr:response regulator transcription factor [Pedobacter cryoconitis]MBB5636882.1 DNA-binding NarL/FixJ family response regulator [Pedobacter cryoconitis]MBB6271281.1 DNA-binding NarL/FixJ family response regulator [Pedobacter cryoconitis]